MSNRQRLSTRERVALFELREAIDYDPLSGTFAWKRGAVSRRCGWISESGYLRIKVLGRSYMAHHLAWALVRGEWPKMLDHANGDPLDNRIANLRPATPRENRGNAKVNANNVSGLKGVQFHPHTGRWRARIRKHGRLVALGLFDTPEKAHAAYVAAAADVFGAFARAK